MITYVFNEDGIQMYFCIFEYLSRVEVRNGWKNQKMKAPSNDWCFKTLPSSVKTSSSLKRSAYISQALVDRILAMKEPFF